MKLVVKLISLIMFTAILVVYFLSIDDDIKPAAEKMYNSVGIHSESDAYEYLLGIYAAIDDDPLQVGKQQLVSLRAEEQRIAAIRIDNQQYNISEYPRAKRLKLFKLKSCKDLKLSRNCDYIDRLFAQPFNLNKISESEKVILERYREFLGKEDFHTLAVPNMMTPLPPYSYLLAGNNLTHLIALDLAENDRADEAISALLADIKLLRHSLQQVDSIILKMIWTRAISNSLDVLSVIIHNQNMTFNQKISGLNALERNMEKPISYEFAMFYNFSKDFKINRQIENHKVNSQLGGILSRKFLYKPNMQINATYPRHQRIVDLSKENAINFARFVENETPLKIKKSVLRNYVGDVMNSVAFPDYSKYVASLFYLNAKIQLFNATSNIKQVPKHPSDIKNPFYDSDSSGVYLENENRLCFKVPDETRASDYCLRVSK